MANPVPCFFYVPTWDYPPEGPVKLGNVITSVKKPEQALYSAPPADIFITDKTSVEYTKDKLRSGRFSILTKFLSVLGFGVDVGAEVSSSNEEKYSFDRIETAQFIPDKSYIQRCVRAEDVLRYLQVSRYRKPIYIVTGLKTVTGANKAGTTLSSRTVGGDVGLEVDGTVWSGGAVPVSGGPGVEAKVTRKNGTRWGGSSDFVFAFRVVRVFVGKKTGDVVGQEDYRKGAMLGRDDDGWEDGGEYGGPELYLERLEEGDAWSEGLEGVEVLDDVDGGTVVCAFPANGRDGGWDKEDGGEEDSGES